MAAASEGEHEETADVLIIGGGIIGTCAAAYLVEAGCRVTVIDRSGICEETSAGNAAALAFSEILPMAQKGMAKKVPGWLLDPVGPLSIPPAYLPTLAPWLWRFLQSGRPALRQAAIETQSALMWLAEREWRQLMERTGTINMLREDGCLELYESETEFTSSLPDWEARERLGIACRHLTRDELPEFQPGLSDRFVRATFVPGWKTVSDPQQLGKAVWAHAEAAGATQVNERVAEAESDGRSVRVRLSDGRELRGDALVVAAGAWSHLIAKGFGDAVPLEAERGYNTTLPADAFDLKRQLVFSRHGFVITPLETGLRVGGAVEFGGLERPPNFARADAMLKKAESFLPGLKTAGGRQWMGHRPSLPDSLPVIGPAAGADNVFYGFGHGHLGLTQAAATGSLLRDLVLGQSSPIDLTPFGPRRFH